MSVCRSLGVDDLHPCCVKLSGLVRDSRCSGLTRSMMCVVTCGTDGVPGDTLLPGQEALLGVYSLVTTSRHNPLTDHAAAMWHVGGDERRKPVYASLLTYIKVMIGTRATCSRNSVKASKGEVVHRSRKRGREQKWNSEGRASIDPCCVSVREGCYHGEGMVEGANRQCMYARTSLLCCLLAAN
jgi:hypothetical protein